MSSTKEEITTEICKIVRTQTSYRVNILTPSSSGIIVNSSNPSIDLSDIHYF